MKNTVKSALLLVALLSSIPAHADFNDGVVALTMGKYDKALQTFLPLAEASDHGFAQYFLARMYAAGQGVEKDTKVAFGWYRKAAEKGIADAQLRLGRLYESGDGGPADMEYAYAWFRVAAHLGSAGGAKAVAAAREKLSDAEYVEAEKLSRGMINDYGTISKSTARTQ
mgnify:CR=1 FL=1